jgi:hypothetical protein
VQSVFLSSVEEEVASLARKARIRHSGKTMGRAPFFLNSNADKDPMDATLHDA